MNARNNYGNTVITLAAINGNADCVKALIAAGADVNAKNKNNNGITVIIFAAVRATLIASRALSPPAGLRRKEEHGWTELMLAAATGDVDGIKALIVAART